jgi:hypothetical protein
MADTGGLQYHSNRAEYWSGIARFQNLRAIAQISVTFIKRSGNTVPTHLYVHAQGDGGTRYLTSVEYAFQRLALNQPSQFTFNDVSIATTNTVYQSNTITLGGSGFTGGTIVFDAMNSISGGMSINGGSYQTGSATVSSGDTVRLRQTTGSVANGATRSCRVTIQNVTDTFDVTVEGQFGGM